MEELIKYVHWKCPHCGHCFKDSIAMRYSKGVLVGTGKFITHCGLRMLGGSLGICLGNINIGSRVGAQVANNLCGNINNIEIFPDRKCPHCGHVIKGKPLKPCYEE